MPIDTTYDDGAMSPEARDEENTDLQSSVAQLVDAAIQFAEGELSEHREKASKYYMAEPFGNEEEGRSQIVSHDVRDVVTTILPSLLRVFWGPERPVEFRPETAEDVPGAEQATHFISKVVLTEDNPGFLIFHSWFKDALLRKPFGAVRWYWHTEDRVESHAASGLVMSDLERLAMDESVTIKSIEQTGQLPAPPAPPPEMGPDGQMVPTGQPPMPEPLFDVQFERTTRIGRACVVPIPPEEMLISPDARSRDEATLIGHRTDKTRGELLAMGLDAEDIDQFGGPSDLDNTVERQTRNPFEEGPDSESSGDPGLRKIEYIEAYVLVSRRLARPEENIAEDDPAGDRLELRRICMLGAGHHIVVNEPANNRPFALLSPNPEPHTIVGLTLADETMDLQKIKSSVLRALLDSLAQSIFPRMGFVEGQVSAEDVFNTAMGAPIRMLQPGMLQPIIVPFVGKEAMPVIEHLDSIKEDRTGISRAAAGLNADALQSSTRAAVAATVQGAQQKIELIARIFAETGVRDLFKGLLQLYVAYQDKPRIMRLRNEWVPVDPRAWNSNMDVTINVALGAGLTEEKIALLAGVAQKQEQTLQLLGPQNPLVTLAQLRHTYAKALELQGFKDVDSFFQPVDPNWQPPQPQEPPPDPNMLIAQAEMQKAQAEVMKKQAEMAAREQELQMQVQEAQARAALEHEKMLREDDRERDKLEAQTMMQAKELELKYNTQVDIANIQAAMDRQRELIKADAARQPLRKVKVSRDSDDNLTVEETTEGGE